IVQLDALLVQRLPQRIQRGYTNQTSARVVLIVFATAIGVAGAFQLIQAVVVVALAVVIGVAHFLDLAQRRVLVLGGMAGAVGVAQQLAGEAPFQLAFTAFGINQTTGILGSEQAVPAGLRVVLWAGGAGKIQVGETFSGAIRMSDLHQTLPVIVDI